VCAKRTSRYGGGQTACTRRNSFQDRQDRGPEPDNEQLEFWTKVETSIIIAGQSSACEASRCQISSAVEEWDLAAAMGLRLGDVKQRQ
jgi:hypothetical protein